VRNKNHIDLVNKQQLLRTGITLLQLCLGLTPLHSSQKRSCNAHLSKALRTNDANNIQLSSPIFKLRQHCYIHTFLSIRNPLHMHENIT